MLHKLIIFQVLSGIAVGLLIGILDSSLHFINFESYKILNITTFILFFIGIYWTVVIVRDRFASGVISYGDAFKSIALTGLVASIFIGITRFVYLKYVISIDINVILNRTRDTMLAKYSLYTTEQISNRLSFIEFSYNPIVSSVLYFVYYLAFVISFALLASLIIKRIDRNISL